MTAHNDQLSDDLLDRVLAKLGFSQQPAPTLQGLHDVYGAWCRNVPFDNVLNRIHIDAADSATLPGNDAPEFFESWLEHSTGGTCWAGNNALYTLIASLGFSARRGVGTMMAAPDIPPNHGTVIVDVEGGAYVVDASILHCEPLRLDEEAETTVDHPAYGATCSKRDGRWHITWKPLHKPEGFDCRIESLDATHEEFSQRYEKSRQFSPFNLQLNSRLVKDDSVVGIVMGHRMEIDGNGLTAHIPVTSENREQILINDLGFSPAIISRLPADVPIEPTQQ